MSAPGLVPPDGGDPCEPHEFADALFDGLSDALRAHCETRATKEELRRYLRDADAAFQALHDWLASGGVLPEPSRKTVGRQSQNGITPRTDH